MGLGGYWPIGYTSLRYYWYGCHPYYWSGRYPDVYEVEGNTYNYYTYNYSNDEQTGNAVVAEPDEAIAVDEQPGEEPDEQTLADICFEDAVEAFESCDYETAVENLDRAVNLEPDDMVIPFAYAQALFANEQYSEATEVLRQALSKLSPEKEGIFFPRGLYSEDEVLFEQIDHLTKETELYSFDADLQLLLGYQLLGVGKLDEALEPLYQAELDQENADAAKILIELVEKIQNDNNQANNITQ